MTFDLTVCMPASAMFQDNNLFNEICYNLEEALNDGVVSLGEYSDLPFNVICNHLSYDPGSLTVEDTTWDMGELYIYYIIPITFTEDI